MAMNVAGQIDPNMLPFELQLGPLPLIGFYGLDIVSNPIHKTIWDAFSANRKIERIALNFKLLPFGTEFPVAKPKTRSYEWYHPKGILKRNWLTKHLNVLPSVVVLFQNLEWSDPQWTEKQLQCASHVQSIKNSLQGRNTQLIVVLIQKGSGGQSTQNDDLLSSERAANLTSMCDINAKLLFVLPYMDQHLMNYILRLESAFHEHSQVYYTQMSKQIRSHRDQLTSSHQGLMVRHQFKLGIISELRQDFNTALKHFKQGYNFLEEIRIVDTNCMEIKTVAGFFNYKICKLMFKLGMPRDAITHFKTHIEKYKSRTGFRELQFEHYAWMSVQYQAFAELFCEAIRNGLPALQTQHPGKYYYKAAEYVGKRKEIFLECLEMPQSPVDNSPPSSNGTSAVLYSDFWGVRGMKTTGEGTSESIVIHLLQEQEKTVNHSATIITLLGQAMAQYKVYKCLRFRKKLAVDMAEEYLKCGDYPKALTLYSLMLSDYRADKWYTIFTEILLKTLRSAYLSASPVDFIVCSIEALSPNILIQNDERIQILENLWKVLQGVAPVSQQQIVPELKQKWDVTLETVKSPVLIDLDKISDVLDCKITFNKSQIKCNESYQLYLFVRNNTDVPLKCRKFTVILYDSKQFYKIFASEAGEYTKRWETLRPMTGEILLEPGKCYKALFQGDATQLVENIEIQIVKIEIEMGGKNYAVMTQSQGLNKTKQFKSNFLQRDCMELISVINSCYVTPTFHLNSCTKQLDQPMLVNEYFQLQVNVINNFDMCLQCVGISITIPANLRNRVFLTSELDPGSMQKFSSHIQINIGDLPMQSNTSITYYLISLTEGSIELKQKLWYQVESNQVEPKITTTLNSLESPTSGNELKTLKDVAGKNPLVNNHDIKIEYLESGAIKKIKEDTIVVSCVEEFNFTGRFYTLSRQALMRAYRNEDFIFRVNLDVKAPLEIEILELIFISDHNITEKWHKNNAKALARRYRQGRTLEDILILRPNRCSSDWLSKDTFLNDDPSKITFHSNKPASEVVQPNTNTIQNSKESVENFSKNLLSVDATASTKGGKTSTDSLNTKSEENVTVSGSKNIFLSKTVYNSAIDSLYQTQNGRNGFINHGKGLMGNTRNNLLFGVYCVRWRRASSPTKINESKFMINGVDIIEPPLNIYCYLTQKVYAKIAVPFRITIKNPTTKVIYLSATLNSAPSFMFAGHRFLNITLFSHKSYDLIFNLYALKAGWQQLPELVLQYDQSQSDTPDQPIPEIQQNELANLVKRWMPKWVFVHPPNMTSTAETTS